MDHPVLKIAIIGTGNVATHLSKRMWECGYSIVQIYGRRLDQAQALAASCGAAATNQPDQLSAAADVYIMAVSDSAIADVAQQLALAGQGLGKLWVHTSGATPAAILAPFFFRYGIFYPLQTFSLSRQADFSKVPICIHAAQPADANLLQEVAVRIGREAVLLSEQQRLALHVAAVFVNNFSNYLFQEGAAIVEEVGLPFDLLHPLIAETASKIQELSPALAQTGPAIRGDQPTMQRHLEYLESRPDDAHLYAFISALIQKQRMK